MASYTNILSYHIPTNRSTATGKLKGLDGMNEIIAQNRISPRAGARLEAENVRWCMYYCNRAMEHSRHFKPIYQHQAVVDITFIEPERKPHRDIPNVYGALKFVLDSITRERTTKRSIKPGCGAIYDDSPDWLDLRVHVVYNDSKVGCDVIIAQRKDDD